MGSRLRLLNDLYFIRNHWSDVKILHSSFKRMYSWSFFGTGSWHVHERTLVPRTRRMTSRQRWLSSHGACAKLSIQAMCSALSSAHGPLRAWTSSSQSESSARFSHPPISSARATVMWRFSRAAANGFEASLDAMLVLIDVDWSGSEWTSGNDKSKRKKWCPTFTPTCK